MRTGVPPTATVPQIGVLIGSIGAQAFLGVSWQAKGTSHVKVPMSRWPPKLLPPSRLGVFS